ncbi:MAG: hypothetical protein AMXMBFR7_28180 [Planctomycetota bacterium]
MKTHAHQHLAYLAVLLTAGLLIGAGEARADGEKVRLIENVWQLPTVNGRSFKLDFRRDRTFTLTGPGGRTVVGEWRASEDELALYAGEDFRHFAYDTNRDRLVLRPTQKDRPCESLLGLMPPNVRGDRVDWLAYCAPQGPIHALPVPGHVHHHPNLPPHAGTPVRYERQWIPAEYKYVNGIFGQVRITVREGRWEEVPVYNLPHGRIDPPGRAVGLTGNHPVFGRDGRNDDRFDRDGRDSDRNDRNDRDGWDRNNRYAFEKR